MIFPWFSNAFPRPKPRRTAGGGTARGSTAAAPNAEPRGAMRRPPPMCRDGDFYFYGDLLVITGYFYGITHSINGVSQLSKKSHQKK